MADFLSETLRAEAELMLSALFVGMVYGFSYDTIRIVRRVAVHRRVFWIAAEDIVFWISVALHAYITFYHGTDGILRGYIIIGIVCGAWLYRVSAGVFYVKYVTRVIATIKRMCVKIKVKFAKNKKIIEKNEINGYNTFQR